MDGLGNFLLQKQAVKFWGWHNDLIAEIGRRCTEPARRVTDQPCAANEFDVMCVISYGCVIGINKGQVLC